MVDRSALAASPASSRGYRVRCRSDRSSLYHRKDRPRSCRSSAAPLAARAYRLRYERRAADARARSQRVAKRDARSVLPTESAVRASASAAVASRYDARRYARSKAASARALVLSPACATTARRPRVRRRRVRARSRAYEIASGEAELPCTHNAANATGVTARSPERYAGRPEPAGVPRFAMLNSLTTSASTDFTAASVMKPKSCTTSTAFLRGGSCGES